MIEKLSKNVQALVEMINEENWKDGRKDEIVGFVYKTEDLERFKKLDGNRGVEPNRLNKIESSMMIKQIPTPGVVNEFDQVIDAQGRLQVCKKNGLPFYYTKIDGIGIEECILLNIYSEKWKEKDTLQRFASTGNVNYIRFVDLMNRYDVNQQTVMKATSVYYHEAKARRGMQDGEMVVEEKAYMEGNRLLGIADELQKVLNMNGRNMKREAVIQAFIACAKDEHFDFKRMKKACDVLAYNWHDVNKFTEILKQLSVEYNKVKGKKKDYMGIVGGYKNSRPVFNLAEKPA